ncbi:MAG: DUF4097 family beta strand repeat-containing protein, partial [Caldisericaceae bacterium]
KEVNGKIYCPDCYKALSFDKAAREKTALIVAVVLVLAVSIIFAMASYHGASRFAPPVFKQSNSNFFTIQPATGEKTLNVVVEFGALKTLSITTSSDRLYSVSYPDSSDISASYSNGTVTIKNIKSVPKIITEPSGSNLELCVSNKIPVNLSIKLGAGNIDIDSRLLTSNTTKIELGAGSIKLNGGDIEDLSAKLGAGNITIEGLFICKRLDVQNGVGNVSLNLSTLNSTCDGSISNGIGNIDVTVPANKGAKISASATNISQSGFSKSDNSYFNSAYTANGAEILLNLASVGRISLSEN